LSDVVVKVPGVVITAQPSPDSAGADGLALRLSRPRIDTGG
jgi:hypothetical protein